jgi:hypothetical protein
LGIQNVNKLIATHGRAKQRLGVFDLRHRRFTEKGAKLFGNTIPSRLLH